MATKYTGEGLSDTDFRAKYGGTGQTGEREFLSGQSGELNVDIEGNKVNLGDTFRAAEREGTFSGLSPQERAMAQARSSLGLSAIGNQGSTLSLEGQDISGDLAEISKRTGAFQGSIIDARRAAAGGVTGDTGEAGDLEKQSFTERSNLPTTGTAQKAKNYWDASRGVNINAPAGSHFELFSGGGVRTVQGDIPEGSADQVKSSLFTQGTTGEGADQKAVEGFTEDKLGIQPAEGKEISRTGRTGKNPETGVDVNVGPDEIFIEYTDGTYEVRKHDGINVPGEAQALSQAGPTAEELGITRKTEIKGGEGTEVTRAPFSAAQALAQAITPEDKDKVITDEGGKSTSELQYVGTTYRGKSAKDGYAFYVDPETKEILQRPDVLKDIAQKLTIAGVAGTKGDVVSKFRAIYGRDPNSEELKYWLTRTDKVGSALIGAMQFAQQSGKGVGGVATADPVENIKNAANQGQGNMAKAFTDDGITTKSSDSTVNKAMENYFATKEPETKSAEEKTKSLLEATQFQEAQADLNRAKDALRTLDTQYIQVLVDEEQRGGGMPSIRRRQAQVDIDYNRTRAELTDEVQAYNDILQSQLAIIGMIREDFRYDQQTAQQEYSNRLNKAMNMYNMAAGEREFAMSVQEQADSKNRQNLAVVMGLAQEGAIDYDSMSQEQKSQIERMEQQVGLPGVTNAMARVGTQPVMSVGSTITAADGTPKTQIISQDPKTGELSISYYSAPFKEKVTGDGSGSGSDDLFGGQKGQSDWEVVLENLLNGATNNNGGNNELTLTEPPFASLTNSSQQYEYPANSGTIWSGDGKGGWK